nr:PAS domain-containing protein [Streptomyces sp. SAJ15]
MDAALCAFDAEGTVTHWNREAERILGWTAAEAVGRRGITGWAARPADGREVEARLMGAMSAAGRQVHEFALLTKEGNRVLVRTQTSVVQGPGGRPAGVYCAFSEVHTQIDLERSIALSETLLDDASWGVILVDADLRPAVVNDHAARALRTGRTALLGRPLGDVLAQGVEEAESALQHVLAEGTPPAPAEMWVTPRARVGGGDAGENDGPGTGSGSGSGAGSVSGERELERRCWRSGFLRLASPLAEEPAPLGVAWIFVDVTDAKQAEQESSRLRFRSNQLHRAARAAAECEDPVEAATVQLDFALAGFADHALIDLVWEPPAVAPVVPPTVARRGGPARSAGGPDAPGASPAVGGTADGARGGLAGLAGDGSAGLPDTTGPVRLVRTAATPAGASGLSPCPCQPVLSGGIPVAYMEGHPALQAAERCGSVRASSGRMEGAAAAQWAATRKWPEGTAHGLCSVLRSRGRTLGVATFLRGPSRRPFDRADAAYAEDVSVRVAAALDLARQLGGPRS